MKCLIVDGDTWCRETLRAMLKNMADCDEASDGCDALARFTRALSAGEPYDLVMLDVMLPGMNGHETARMIREAERELHSCRKVHIISLSAGYSVHDAMESFRTTRSAALLLKPVRIEGLFAVLAKLGFLAPSAGAALAAASPVGRVRRAHP
jgi:two-component system, chemotaxis family, chemotaxis protein CheY